MENSGFSLFYKTGIGDLLLQISMDASFASIPEKHNIPPEERDLHFHAQYEIFFVAREPLILQTAAGTQEYTDCIVVAAPFVYHEVLERGSSRRFFFEMQKSATAGAKGHILESMKRLLGNGVTVLPAQSSISLYLTELSGCYDAEAPIWQEKATALLKLIFIQLCQQSGTLQKSLTHTTFDDYCIIIDNIINSEYSKTISLSYMAKALHLSTKQTSRIIRKKYHMTLGELIREKRLRVAALLLQNTSKPIGEIALQLFPSSESYFYRLFRKRFGISPLEYRKRKKSHQTV